VIEWCNQFRTKQMTAKELLLKCHGWELDLGTDGGREYILETTKTAWQQIQEQPGLEGKLT
jgi:hypothetical protein